MAEKTLDAMQGGGICDQLGGGFHRYSTDAKWNVPHFEKMLYDQALLLMAYTEAYQATRRQSYRQTAEATIAYVLRDLSSPEGAFYSGEDADSPGGEGRFYLWTVAEMDHALGPEDALIASLIYGATKEGNFQSPEHGKGMNILSRVVPLGTVAASLGLREPELEARLKSIRQRLFSVRLNRPRPSRDGKILADWNGLVIAALAQASRAFDEPRYWIRHVMRWSSSCRACMTHRAVSSTAISPVMPGYRDFPAIMHRSSLRSLNCTKPRLTSGSFPPPLS